MSRLARVRPEQERTSQRLRGDGLRPALADSSWHLYNWPSIPPPQCRLLAWRRVEDDVKHRKMWSTHSLLSQPGAWLANNYGSTALWLYRHPYIDALKTSVSIERQFSRISPAFPRSLASVLIPRPAARRVSASPLRAPSGFRLSENLCATNAKRFSEPSEKDVAWPWERGTSRRVAQECPEGNSGKYTQEK